MTSIHRRGFLRQSAGIGLALAASTKLEAKGANERINLGFIGAGGRANELLPQFAELAGVRIAAMCDPDEDRLGQTASKFSVTAKYADLRKLIDDKSVDAVVIATCNHWHALAAILACQAGKDVYVEKPLSHSHWEGQQVVKAARKYDRIVQLGTQQRSDPLQAKLKKYLHEDKALGAIKYAQVCRFGPREPIGKRATPLQLPAKVNYDLWLGPAEDKPIFRDKLHYDWHWDWNTGNGEMGNWGVHVLDDAVNVVLRDSCPYPKRVTAGGGRLVWDDAGETPNVCFAFYDTGAVPILFGLSNLPNGPKAKRGVKIDGVATGYVIHCEGGYYAGGRGGGASFDNDGKQIRKFSGDSGKAHPQNFADAVRAHDRSILNAEVEIGHQSTAWCNLADVAQRAGKQYAHDKAVTIREDFAPWGTLVEVIEEHLANNSVDPAKAEFRLGPTLEFDSASQKFVGDAGKKANRYLRREYRKKFEVPEIA